MSPDLDGSIDEAVGTSAVLDGRLEALHDAPTELVALLRDVNSLRSAGHGKEGGRGRGGGVGGEEGGVEGEGKKEAGGCDLEFRGKEVRMGGCEQALQSWR